MHIEPGIVDGAKITLSYVTAAGALSLAGKMARDNIHETGLATFAMRSMITTSLVLAFFEVLPHHPVGVSEVHLILGSTLLLLFGAGAASVGLALGLLTQSLLFAPWDLPQYGMNVTTLLVPLYGISFVAKRIISPVTAYVDLSYRSVLALSVTFQSGIVAWVAFWALYGKGLSTETVADIGMFGAAYMSVIAIEPLIDLGVLAIAKVFHAYSRNRVFNTRLHHSDLAV